MQKYEVFINHHRLKFTNNPTNIKSNVYYYNKDFNWQIILLKFQEKKPHDWYKKKREKKNMQKETMVRGNN